MRLAAPILDPRSSTTMRAAEAPLAALLLLLPFLPASEALAFPAPAPAMAPAMAPEVPPARLARVCGLVSAALGDQEEDGGDGGDDGGGGGGGGGDRRKGGRYASAREAAGSFGAGTSLPGSELVYGELSVPTLATILDAVGAMRALLADTTLAVCFATTWCQGNFRGDGGGGDGSEEEGGGKAAPARAARASLRGRELPRLSRALAALPPGARAVIVDGRLDAEGGGFDWLGDLRITCPDTAPHSTAALYRRREE